MGVSGYPGFPRLSDNPHIGGGVKHEASALEVSNGRAVEGGKDQSSGVRNAQLLGGVDAGVKSSGLS